MKIIENRERSIQKKFRVNEKENERIKLMMRKTGITNFSIFARRACCNKEIFSIDFSEYKNIISEISATKSELKRIGNNINQIAKHLNENKNNQTESLMSDYPSSTACSRCSVSSRTSGASRTSPQISDTVNGASSRVAISSGCARIGRSNLCKISSAGRWGAMLATNRPS